MIDIKRDTLTIGKNVAFREGMDIDWLISEGIRAYIEEYGIEPSEVWVHPMVQVSNTVSGVPVYALANMFYDSAWITGTMEKPTLEGYGQI